MIMQLEVMTQSHTIKKKKMPISKTTPVVVTMITMIDMWATGV